MTETARSEESDREDSDQGDTFGERADIRCTDKGPTTCEEKHGDPSHGDDNPQPLHQRMDPSNKQRKIDGELDYARRRSLQSAMAAQDVFLRAGYDMRPYYGWLPGIAAPLRLPGFIYPPTLFGFAPQNVDVTRKEQSNELNPDVSDAKWEESKAESVQLVRGNLGVNIERGTTFQGHNGFLARSDEFEKLNNNNNNALQHDAKSDVDEGLELDEYDSKNLTKTLRRSRSSPESDELSSTRLATTVSVIQANCTAQKSTRNTRDDDDADEYSETDDATKRLAKRGRASTRRIEKTEQYWDRRKKNNVSAKKSRDARRQREIVTNQRSSMLETENLRLRGEVATLKDENERLKKELSNVTSA